MKTFLTLASCFFITFVFTQSNEDLIKKSILQSINKIRFEKNLGNIDTTIESNHISSFFYELLGKVDKNEIIFKSGYSDKWAAYDCQKLTIHVSKNEKNTENITKSIDSLFNLLISKYGYTQVKWYTFDNAKYPKPIVLGIYVCKIDDYPKKSYATFDIMVNSIKNVPEMEKCLLSEN
jgi:hypothetical protein